MGRMFDDLSPAGQQIEIIVLTCHEQLFEGIGKSICLCGQLIPRSWPRAASTAMLCPMTSEAEIPVFDIEGLVKRLTDAGMAEALARVVAEQQAQVHKLVHQGRVETPPDAGD